MASVKRGVIHDVNARAIFAMDGAENQKGRTRSFSDFDRLPSPHTNPAYVVECIDEHNSRMMERFGVLGTLDVETMLRMRNDDNRPKEIRDRLAQAEESAKWSRLEAMQAVGFFATDTANQAYREELATCNMLERLPTEEIRRKVSVPAPTTNMGAGIVNTVENGDTVYVKAEPAFLAQFDSPKPEYVEPVASKEKKQSVRRAIVRRIRFTASLHYHRVSSVRRVDGQWTIRFWEPVDMVKRAGRYTAVRNTEYKIRSMSLSRYLATFA